MKILYISQARFPSEISHSLSIMKMAQAFHDENHDVILTGIGPNTPSTELFSYFGIKGGFRIHITSIPSFAKRLFLSTIIHSYNVRKIIKKEKPDIIYSRICLLPIQFVPKNIPLIYEMHGPAPLEKSWIHKLLFTSLIKRKVITRIVVTTNMLKKHLQERFPDIEITLARLSAEKPIPISKKKISDFKKKNLKGKNTFSVGYTGFLDNYGLRGTNIICEIAKHLPNVDFHVVGGTPEMVTYWKRQAQSQNIYFYGHKPSNIIPYYLKSFDVVLAPMQLKKSYNSSLTEGMSPLKIPQYMSYQCAIVASDIPAHTEILKDKQTALLVKYNDIEQWVKAICTLRSDLILRKNLQHNAYKTYQSHLTPRKRVERIIAGIETISHI